MHGKAFKSNDLKASKLVRDPYGTELEPNCDRLRQINSLLRYCIKYRIYEK
jgi:hypothetical protein